MRDLSAAALAERYPWYAAARDALLADVDLIKIDAPILPSRLPFLCAQCGQRFPKNSALRSHLRGHARRERR